MNWQSMATWSGQLRGASIEANLSGCKLFDAKLLRTQEVPQVVITGYEID